MKIMHQPTKHRLYVIFPMAYPFGGKGAGKVDNPGKKVRMLDGVGDAVDMDEHRNDRAAPRDPIEISSKLKITIW